MVGFSRREGTLIVALLNIFNRLGLNRFFLESSSRFLEEEMNRRDGNNLCFSVSLEDSELNNFF